MSWSSAIDAPMTIKDEDICKIAIRYREAITRADLSEELVGEEAYLRMDKFPQLACAEACELLGVHLTNEYEVCHLQKARASVEHDNGWGHHLWLEREGLIIDITPDQFDAIQSKVIVTRNSDFHSNHFGRVKIVSTDFSLDNRPDWFQRIYFSIARAIGSL